MTPARLERLCEGRCADEAITLTVAQARALLSHLAGTAHLVERPFTPPADAKATPADGGHWELGVDLGGLADRPPFRTAVLTPPPAQTLLPTPPAARVRRWCGPWLPGWKAPTEENP